MLLAERLVLLDRKLDGSPWAAPRPSAELNRWLAASCLVELAAMGRLSFAAGMVSSCDELPAHYMLLNDAQSIVRRRAQSAREAVEAVHRGMPRIAPDLLASLVRRGILFEERTRRLGLFSSTRHPVQSTSAYHESARLLRRGAEDLGVQDLWALGLMLLVDGMGILNALLPDLALDLEKKLHRFETFVSGSRAAADPSAQRARLILALTQLR